MATSAAAQAPSRRPPGSRLPMVAQTYQWVRKPTEFMERCRREYGPTFVVRLPPREIVFFSEPGDIKQIFAARGDEMHAGEFNYILRPIIGQSSVLLLDEREHMRHRKLLMPPFHGERMRLYGQAMQDIALADIAKWPIGKPFALHPHMQAVTLDIILRTVFGLEEGREFDQLRSHIQQLLSRGDLPVSMPLLVILSDKPDRERRAPFKWLLFDRKRVDSGIYKQIAARRQEGDAGHTDVLSLLLAARDEDGKPLTDDEVRDELMTTLAAGHETTATALCWAFERILSEPRVHERLVQEIDAVVKDGTLRPEYVARLEYLDATLREVLRQRPILPLVGRILKHPTTIGGYALEAGTAVAACIYLAHRNPSTYPDPEVFRPERFLGVKEDPSTWLPFGGGLRRCLGAAFAFYEMKLVTAAILSSCRLTLAQPTPARVVRRAITLSPQHGTRVIATRR